jgi:hypothetical protein
VAFIPERNGLAPLARRMARSKRAYALFDVARMFLRKPEYYAVRVVAAAGEGAEPDTLYQCRECGMVFADQGRALSHIFGRHFESFYRREEVQTEPPSGSFVCVARCGLSGALLGPPNYHGFVERLRDVHRTAYPQMSLDDYRSRVENVRDAELIERWRSEAGTRILYHTVDDSAPHSFTRFADMEAHFLKHLAPRVLRKGHRFIMPGPTSRDLEDPVIRNAVRELWTRERRFPLKLSIALRSAFKHLGLHVFRGPNGDVFLSSVPPKILDARKTVPGIRAILEYIVAHPDSRRADLAQGLGLNGGEKDPDATEGLGPLRWLVERGHVIEHADGRLDVPRTKADRKGA